jgi:Fe-S-cluster containining protein
MGLDLVQIRKKAEEKADENWRFRRFLKDRCDLEPDELDQLVFEITRRVWAGIDCTECANCCREVHPTFSDDEVERLARRLKMDRREFIEKYLKATEPGDENPWETRTLPCPFLEGNRCSVYEDRPADCSGYPYLDKPDFGCRTMAMVERASTCPIVYEVLEELKPVLGFRRHPRRGDSRR